MAKFTAGAEAANATVRVLDALADVPDCISGLLRERNMAATVHLPMDTDLSALQWHIGVSHTAPGQEDAAVSVAPFGIAETGTLVFPSGTGQSASWHFRPGFEIAVLREENIAADLESVLAGLREREWPATINLVTGPSRTADIEQTLELGAHGPRALAILLIRMRRAG